MKTLPLLFAAAVLAAPFAHAADAAAGKAKVDAVCAACHGVDRKGNAAANIPSLEQVGQRLKLPQKQVEATLASHAELQRIEAVLIQLASQLETTTPS